MLRFRAAIGLALGLILAQPALAQDVQRMMDVTGVGQVEVVPDMAIVSLGVEEQGATAGDAVRAMSMSTSTVFETLAAAGVQSIDVQTSGLNLHPIYNRGSLPTAPQLVVGFSASTSFSVKVRDLDALGRVLDQMVTAGVNRFQGITFDVSERETLMDKARRAAVADARRKAELYAEGAGVTLGEVLAISESPSGGVPIPLARAETMAMAAVPVMAGQSVVEATVQIRFSIK